MNDLYVCALFFSSTAHGGRVWRQKVMYACVLLSFVNDLYVCA